MRFNCTIVLVGIGTVFLAHAGCTRDTDGLENPDPLRRVEALRSVQARHDRDFEERVLKLLKDPSSRVRRAALAALGPVGAKDNLSAVIDRLRDKELGVRLGAVRLLARTESEGAKNALLQLRLNADGLMAGELRQALTKLGMSPLQQKKAESDTLWQRQIELLSRGSDEARHRAVEMLALNEEQRSVAVLARYLKVDSPALHLSLVAAIARIGGKEAVRILELMSRSQNVGDRIAVAKSAIFGRLSADLLGRLLKDKDARVRRAVLSALPKAASGEPSALIQTLRPLICDQLNDVSVAADVAAAMVRHRLPCREARKIWFKRVQQSQRSEEHLPALLILSGEGVDQVLLSWAKAIENTYLSESKSWLSGKAWAALDDAKPAPAGTRGPVVKKKGVASLLSRYPAVRGSKRGLPDSLLPPVQAVDLLGEIVAALGGRPQARAYLLHLAVRGKPFALRRGAFKALGKFDRPTDDGAEAAAILRVLIGNDRLLRQSAMAACHLAGQKAARLLPEWLGDRTPQIREGAVRCAARLAKTSASKARSKQLSQQLGAMAANEQSPAAIAALGDLGDGESATILAKLLNGENFGSVGRRLAVEGLGRLASRNPEWARVEPLARCLDDEAPAIRLAAALALRGIRPKSQAMASLGLCAADFYGEIRRACAAALR